MPPRGRKCAWGVAGGLRSRGERCPFFLVGGDLPSLRSATSPAPCRGGPCKREKAADGPSGHPGCSRFQPLRKQAFDGPETKTAGRIRDQLPFPFAEEGGFEPPIPREGYTGFRDQRLQPLGHPSLWDCKDNTKKQTNKKEAVFCNWLIMSRKGEVPIHILGVGTFRKLFIIN